MSASQSLIAGGAAVLGSLVGGTATYLASRASWRRSESASLIEPLVGLYEVAWMNVDHFREAESQVELIRLRLGHLGVSDGLRKELAESALQCWREIRSDLDTGSFDPNYGPGMSSASLDRFRTAVELTARELRGEPWWRRSRRRLNRLLRR